MGNVFDRDESIRAAFPGREMQLSLFFPANAFAPVLPVRSSCDLTPLNTHFLGNRRSRDPAYVSSVSVQLLACRFSRYIAKHSAQSPRCNGNDDKTSLASIRGIKRRNYFFSLLRLFQLFMLTNCK